MVIKMKLLIVSDIHGGYEELLKITKNEVFDKLIILGDLFSYGYSYDKENEENIINLLEKYKNKLIILKGNCDTLVNYEILGLNAFEIITLPFNNSLISFTHGNKYKKGFLPEYHGNIFISGHTHVPVIEKQNDIIYANPGSISKPRNGSYKSYLIFDNNKLILKTIDKIIIKEMIIN